MHDTPEPAPHDALAESGSVSSWRDFHSRVEAAMAVLAAEPADLWLVDADFAQWPLGQRSVMEALHRWAVAPSRHRITVLAGGYDGFARCHPRWVAWQRTWGHRVRCWQAPAECAADLKPTLILGQSLALRVAEPRMGTGWWTRESARIANWRAEIDAILQRSEEAPSSTPLGL
jgi:hypothetical protein